MKRSILVATAIMVGIVSTVKAEYCDLEKLTINSLKGQLEIVETQLHNAEINRNASAVNAIGTLLAISALTKGSFGRDSGSFKLVAGSTFAASALNVTNIYLRQKDVSFYQSLATSVRKSLDEKESQISSGTCLSEDAKKTSNEKAKEFLKILTTVNTNLQADVNALKAELGGVGNLSKLVNVGVSIILIAGTGLMQIKNQSPTTIGIVLRLLGSLLNTGAQVVQLPSILITTREAKAILEKIKDEQNKLVAQEQLLRQVLAGEQK